MALSQSKREYGQSLAATELSQGNNLIEYWRTIPIMNTAMNKLMRICGNIVIETPEAAGGSISLRLEKNLKPIDLPLAIILWQHRKITMMKMDKVPIIR